MEHIKEKLNELPKGLESVSSQGLDTLPTPGSVQKSDGEGKIEWVKPDELNPQQELFCQFYTQKGNSFMNATIAYNLAYDRGLEEKSKETELDDNMRPLKGSSPFEKEYAMCQTSGSRLLSKAVIKARVKELLKKYLSEDEVDAVHGELLMSDDDTIRLGAVKHFNDLRGRIVKKFDHTTLGGAINAPTSDLAKIMIEDREKRAEIIKAKLAE